MYQIKNGSQQRTKAPIMIPNVLAALGFHTQQQQHGGGGKNNLGRLSVASAENQTSRTIRHSSGDTIAGIERIDHKRLSGVAVQNLWRMDDFCGIKKTKKKKTLKWIFILNCVTNFKNQSEKQNPNSKYLKLCRETFSACFRGRFLFTKFYLWWRLF